MDNNNLQYPVKYEVMPIIVPTGWGLSEFNMIYDTVANIVVKCYVINEIKTYFEDGTSEMNYEIVYLYDRPNIAKYPDNFEPMIPKYDVWHKCYNSHKVKQLFDNFEEAKEIAEKENEKILEKTLVSVSREEFDNHYDEIFEEHQKKLESYQKIEAMIEQETKDVKITSFETEQYLDKKPKQLKKTR